MTKSECMQLWRLCVILNEAKGLKDQILRSAQNDIPERLQCKVDDCYVV